MSGPIDAIWFGLLVVKLAESCLITPPIGLNCFVVAGQRDDLTVQDEFKGVTPFSERTASPLRCSWPFRGSCCGCCHLCQRGQAI